MACVALASLAATIQLQFLQPIPRVSLDDHRPMKSLYEKIFSMRTFLRKESSAAIRYLEIMIRDFALKAEDEIEIQLRNFLLAKDEARQENASQKLHQTLREAAQKATELLEIIINNTSNESQPSSFRRSSNGASKSAAENVKKSSQIYCPKPAEVKMVGRRHDCSVIKDQIFRNKDDLKLIAIVGMKGIGKTTVAKSVYRDPSVARCFHLRRWITMPQKCSRTQILRHLLQSISPIDAYQVKKRSSSERLTEQVRRCLIGKTYLIVFDNLMNNQVWEDIQECFPDEGSDSCILVTTTHFDQSNYRGSRYYIHIMTLLDAKESWGIFCNVLSPKQCMAPKFEEIRSQVLEVCDGLPLLVVEVAKHLSKCDNIQQEWEKIKKKIEALGILDRNALTISYNQLPHELKVCFLYFGVFPKRRNILVKTLIRLWNAEGFLKQQENHQEVETQAYEYLQGLIDRSFVLICDPGSDGKIKSCRMHSAMHSFCVGEAQKEGIFCAVNTQQHPRVSLNTFANSGRWLSLYKHCFDYYVLFSTNNPRSLFFFHENPEMFVPFKLLRVLAFVPSPFLQSLSMHSEDLVFLRYLSVTQWVEGLSDIVATNPNLRTLIISGNKSNLEAPTLLLPSKIWELPQLRHLELGNMYAIDPPSMVKENLETLSWVSPTHCREEVVYNSFPNIRKLKIFYKDEVGPDHTRGSCSNPIILDNLNYLERLEKLTISVLAGCNVTLSKLSMFPFQLKKLKLSGTDLSESDLMAIGTLCHLKVLKLQNAFHGKVWEVAKRGFSSLRYLLLEAENLEQLMAKKYSFPMIRRLVLRYCNHLEKIPWRLRYRPSLQSIELERCHHSAITSAMQIRDGLPPSRKEMFEIKIKGSEYDDESQHTHTEESDEDDSEDSTEDEWEESPEDSLDEFDKFDSVEEQLL